MAVTVDVRSAGAKTAGAGSLDMTHTVNSGTNRILVVSPTTGSGSAVPVTAVAWDVAGVNEALTNRANVADPNCIAYIWDKVAPTAGASKTIRVTTASSCEITVSAASYFNVDQATPWRGAAWPTDAHAPSGGTPQPSMGITTVASDVAIMAVFSNENGATDDIFTATGTSTLIGSQNVGPGKHSGGMCDCPAVGTVTIPSFAGVSDANNWGVVGGALPFDGGGGGGGTTGSGAVTVPAFSVSGAGKRGLLGTGTAAVAVVLAGTGKQTQSGTGSVAVKSKIALSGTSTLNVSGTGATSVSFSLSGAGKRGLIGAGAETVSLALSGTGKIGNTGTGSVAVSSRFTLAGTGIRGIIGTGSVAVPYPTLGFGDNLLIPPFSLSGTGIRGIIGSGSASLSMSLSGAGKRGLIGTGSAAVKSLITLNGTAPGVTVSGSGTVAVSLTLSSSGKQTHTGTGAAVVALSLSATGKGGNIGTGSAAVHLSLFGSSGLLVAGSGAVTIAQPSLLGAGKRGAIGTGGVSIVAPTFSGTGKLGIVGTGSAAVAMPSLHGTSSTPLVGLGAVLMALSLAATGSNTSFTTRPAGAYKNEHDSALADLIAAGGR